jgi:thioesterase domain-containing protein/aryl carrier-like protein
MVLPSLPLNANGKLDRKALPEPTWETVKYEAPRNELEQTLARVWQSVLQIERVGIHDNFFELGGDSLRCIQVLSQLRKLADPRLDFNLRDLLQRPTIAALLRVPAAAPVLEPLPLNRSPRSEPPLFCIHASMGTLFDYQPLARHLQRQRAVYGLPCRMLLDAKHRDASLEAIATEHCRAIRTAQPEGPYHLLGWSLGGTLAARIAALLEREGERVAFLGLVDPYVLALERDQGSTAEENLTPALLDFIGVAMPAALETARTLLGSLTRQHGWEAQVQEIIAQLRGRDGDGMPSEDIARAFIVSRHLQALANAAPALSKLEVVPHCWWIESRSATERTALATQIGHPQLRATSIASSHYDILRNETVLTMIQEALRVPTRATTTSPVAVE